MSPDYCQKEIDQYLIFPTSFEIFRKLLYYFRPITMSIIVFFLSIILCHTITEGSLKVPFLKRDMEVGQTLEEFPSEEVGNQRRRWGWRWIRPRDCKLYRRRDRHEVFLFLDGQCRHIPDPPTFNRLFTSWGAIHVISRGRWPNCRRGRSISRGAFLGRGHGRHEVYLFSNGMKRHIASPSTMSKCNFSWGRVRLMSTRDVDRTPTGHRIR